MSSSGKSKKKAKWKTVALEDILPNTVVRPSQSWADEVEDELNEYTIKKITSINLPTAPRAATDLVIDESKIPANGPFMAYLSNLPYEITEDDIAQHFSDLKVSNIQLPKDSRHDRMRGFGYVEFENKSSLLTALHQGEVTLKNRLVRISLPNEDEHKDKNSRSGGMSFSRRDASDRMDGGEKNLGEWRAAAPIPHDPDKGFTRPGLRDEPSGGGGRPFRDRPFDPEPSGSFSRGGGGFRDRDRDFGGRSNDRDFGGRSNDRDFGGRSNDRDFGGRSNDRDRDGGNRIFGKKYDREDRGGGRMGFGRNKPFEPREEREFVRRELPPAAEKEEPKSRPKLEIQPRTKPIEPNVPDALPSSIFGGAKPVDTLKREMEIEAKLSAASSLPTASRSRGSSPHPISTPRSGRSRSSSISSYRRQDNDNADTAYESQPAGQSDNESKDSNKQEDSSGPKQSEFKEPQPPPKNVWEQRKAKTQATTVPSESNVSDTSSSVIEKSNAYETNSIDKTVESRSQPEDGAGQQQPPQTSSSNAENRLSSDEIYQRPTHRTANATSDDDFVRYEPDHFRNSDAASSQHSSNRGGDRGGGRPDSKFNFGRDRERDRDRDRDYRGRDNRRENRGRKPDNGGQFRRDDRRDDHYGGRPSDSKYGSFSRNRRGGDRDRDNGFYRGGDSRNTDGGANFSNRSSNSSSTTNLRDEDRFDSRRHDERLNQEVRRRDDDRRAKEPSASSGGPAAVAPTSVAEDRLKIVDDDNANRKTVENGNENGVGGVDSAEDAARQSNESISTNEQSEFNDNSFSCSKNRKKDKKKKREGDEIDANDKASDTQRNLKDDKKKGIDNQVNDKTNNKNNAKNKDKNTKKNRELRDDATTLPKAKEEKAPNFQGSNRFLYLETDE